MNNLLRDNLGRLFRWNETRIHELNYLFWECTTRCNLHCRHCGSDCTAPGMTPAEAPHHRAVTLQQLVVCTIAVHLPI